MSTFFQDLRYSLRLLAKSPGFTAIAVLTLAIGLGANTTVFSWIQSMLLEPLQGVPDQDRIRIITGMSRSGDMRSMSVPDIRDIQKMDAPLSVVAYQMTSLNLTGGERPERVWASVVTGNVFDVLEVRPVLGRAFRPEEDAAPNAYPVTVLSHAFWKRRFEGDPKIIGRTIQLNGHAYTVIGVAPPDYLGEQIAMQMDLWIPIAMQEQIIAGGSRLEERGHHWLQAMVRLRPGVTQEQAQAALDTLAARLAKEYPETNDGLRFPLYRFWKSPTGPSGFLAPVLTVLGTMALLVLLLACANVANLLLVRAISRRKEIAIRLAMGAGRGRLIRQLLTESLVLVILAGGLGVLFALWGTRLLIAFLPPMDAPLASTFGLDGEVLTFAAVLALLTGLLFSLAPALQLSAPGVASTLRDEGGSVAGGRKGFLRSSLVVTQIFLSCVLLIAAGLFVRSLGKASEIDIGFDSRNLLLAAVDVFPNGYDEARGTVFYRDLLQRLSGLPGIESATVSTLVPLDFDSWSSSLEVEGYQPAPKEEMSIGFSIVGPDYMKALGIPLKAGRDFTFADQDPPRKDGEGDDDEKQPPGTMIVNETMAQRYWAGRQALGGRVRLWNRDWTVVGIARNGKYNEIGEAPKPYFYVPEFQAYQSRMVIHVRTAGDPLEMVEPLRSEVRAMDPNIPLSAVKTMEEHLRLSVFAQRLAATFLGSFGLLALLLATIGLYSVIRYTVSQRTREIGVRMALGARPGQVARLVLDQGMILAAVGLGIGLAAAFGVTRFLASQLLGVSATDPLVFVVVALLLAAVSALASYLPARVAAAVDPIVALRRE
ncbi:MAG TPA: ABC transporter permease [Thermoanaerobaculia bacterium]